MARRNRDERRKKRLQKLEDRATILNVDANLSTTSESDAEKLKRKAKKVERKAGKLEAKIDPSVRQEQERKELVEKRDKKLQKLDTKVEKKKAKGKYVDFVDKEEGKRAKITQDFQQGVTESRGQAETEKNQILSSSASFKQKQEALKQRADAEREQGDESAKQDRIGKQLLRGAKKIVKRIDKGKQVGKILKKRAVKKAMEFGASQELVDGFEDILDQANALNKVDRNKMFEMGSGTAGSAAPSIDTSGMTSADKRRVAAAQMASDLEYFKMMNPVLKPTDYYPQAGRSIAVGTSTGEIIGSRTIYTGAGVLAPMGLYDARKRALAAAAKAGIANAQGEMPTLPRVRDQYVQRYEDYTKDMLREIRSDKDNFDKNGKLTPSARARIQEAVELGNTINRALARADEFQDHLTKEKTSGKGGMTGIDDVYYSKKTTKLMRELLTGDYDFDNFKNKDILREIASGEGMEFRNAQKDFQSEILPRLQAEAAQDRQNLLDGTYQSAEGKDSSDFIDKKSGLLTQAYMKTVSDARIKNAVENFYKANEGVYSDEQKDSLIALAQSQIGKQETITTKEQSSGGGGGSSAAKRYYNTYFDGTTRGLKRATVPVIESLDNSAGNDEILEAYLTTIGGVGGTTKMIDGDTVPVTRNSLGIEGSPMAIGSGMVSNLFAVNTKNGYEQLTGEEIERRLADGEGMTAYGTGTECKLGWFQAYNDMGDIPESQIYARATEDINALGYIDGGEVIPLKSGTVGDFKNAPDSNKVQIKSMMYMPFLKQPVLLETRDAKGNFQSSIVRELESTGGAYLVSKRTTTIPFNSYQQINTQLSNIMSDDFTSDKNLRTP